MNSPATRKKRGPANMTDEHKAALDRGRKEGRAVKAYLDALEASRPRRGRKRTAESIAKRLEKIDAEIEEAAPVQRLQMVQERMDLQAELEAMSDVTDIAALEEGFVSVAAAYSDRKGISYAAWREVGIDAGVLRRAGIKRGA